MFRIVVIALVLSFGAMLTFAQVEKVCISQEAANKCRDNALELPVQKQKVRVLEDALKKKDKSNKDLKELNKKNIEDLRKRIAELTSQLAFTKGQLSKAEAQILWQIEILKGVLPKLRKKCSGLVLFC